MSKCLACEIEVEREWNFCPLCGIKLDSTKDISRYPTDRTHLFQNHLIPSKYAGRVIGEEIIRTSGIEGLDKVLSYLEDIFSYWKVGILKSVISSDEVIITMDESAFAYGVNNIHMKLCIFLAGIIKGALNGATTKKWDVTETKCIANGDSHCEFRCKEL